MKCECPTGAKKRYRWTVTVQRPASNPTPDASGHVDLTLDANWTTQGTIRANFKSRGGSERFIEDRLEATQTHILETRSTELSRSIVPKWRLQFDSRTFHVESAYDVDEMRQEVNIHVREGK